MFFQFFKKNEIDDKPPSTNNNDNSKKDEEEEEIDPLEAFMSGVQSTIEKEEKQPKKEKAVRTDIEGFFFFEFL